MLLRSNGSRLLKLTEDDIFERFGQIVVKHGGATLGDRMNAPVCLMLDGKLYQEPEIQIEDVFQVAFTVPHVSKPLQSVSAGAFRVHVQDLIEGRISAITPQYYEGHYVHLYEAKLPYERLLTEKRPGDSMWVVDEEYDKTQIILTEEQYQMHEVVDIRFGVSKI